MIVRVLSGELLLITQPDHAHLAGAIMANAQALRDHPRRDSILLAVTEHDNGWAEPDSAPSVGPAGDVVDFIGAPVAVRQGVWPRAVARLSSNPWTAALVAQHAITVYDRFRSDDAWTQFFADMTALRDSELARSNEKAGLDDLAADYAFVRLGDLISLTFCTGWTTAQHFGDWTVERNGDRISVTPDLFGGAELPIEVIARVLPHVTFPSDHELHEALTGAATATLSGTVAGR